ncbi:MAG: hypothetical protein JNJ57_02665 [Saprospiraceae bacterium]|nr:hypothetical protein [Saprospiraceae bacterium]
MRRLLFPILFFAFLFWPVVRTQTQQAKTLPLAEALLKAKFNQIDTLIAHQHIDSALTRLDTMITVFEDAENWKAYQEAVVKSAGALTKQKKFEAVQLKIANALETLEEADMGDSLVCAKLWSWQAVNYRRMNNYVDALSSYIEAIELYENNSYLGSELAYAYKNAAQIYMRFSENRRALSLLESAIHSDTSGAH